MNSINPAQAREFLHEAANRADLSRAHARVGATFTGGVAILVAATLAAATFWRDNAVGIGVSMGLYAALLTVLLWWHATRFRIADRLWRRRYVWGFGLTMALYMAGIVWESSAFPGWAIFGPYCVLVAVPGMVAALRMLSR